MANLGSGSIGCVDRLILSGMYTSPALLVCPTKLGLAEAGNVAVTMSNVLGTRLLCTTALLRGAWGGLSGTWVFTAVCCSAWYQGHLEQYTVVFHL